MNKHLNIFRHFNSQDVDSDYYENNLSRAFTLCLKYDSMLLDNVLKKVLGNKLYDKHFSTVFSNISIEIDLQIKTKSLTGFRRIIAVACSASEIISFENIVPSIVGSPETDVYLSLEDTCVIFEFKRTNEDCSAQLLGQAESIKSACEDDVTITPIDFCWPKIINLALKVLSLQKQTNNENYFTRDFISFLELRHPDWFPKRPLNNIPFPISKSGQEKHPSCYYLESRMKNILALVHGEENIQESGGRYSIKVDFKWASEVLLDYSKNESEDNFLQVKIYPADTKQQGWNLYHKSHDINFPNKVKGYDLIVNPYIKFSHFNKGVCWISNLTKVQAKRTHSYTFFKKYVGKWGKESWQEFDNVLKPIISNWNTISSWSDIFSTKSYFVVTNGFELIVKIPYKQAQKLDECSDENNQLATTIRAIIEDIRSNIDNSVW